MLIPKDTRDKASGTYYSPTFTPKKAPRKDDKFARDGVLESTRGLLDVRDCPMLYLECFHHSKRFGTTCRLNAFCSCGTKEMDMKWFLTPTFTGAG